MILICIVFNNSIILIYIVFNNYIILIVLYLTIILIYINYIIVDWFCNLLCFLVHL